MQSVRLMFIHAAKQIIPLTKKCVIFGFAGGMDSVCQSTTLIWTDILKSLGLISLEFCTNIHLPQITHTYNSGEALTVLFAPP